MNEISSIAERKIKDLARKITKTEQDIDALKKQRRADQLGFSSVEDDFVLVNDLDGTPRQVLGKQEDGSFTSVDKNAPPLDIPSKPITTVKPGLVVIEWDGGKALTNTPWRADFKRVNVQVLPVGSIDPFHYSFERVAGGSVTVALDPGYCYVIFNAENTSGVSTANSSYAIAVVQVTSAPVTESGASIYRSSSAPQGLGVDDEALWYDTNNGNLMSVWTGTAWDPKPAGSGALQDGSVVGSKLESDLVLSSRIVAGDINAGRVEINPTQLAAYGRFGIWAVMPTPSPKQATVASLVEVGGKVYIFSRFQGPYIPATPPEAYAYDIGSDSWSAPIGNLLSPGGANQPPSGEVRFGAGAGAVVIGDKIHLIGGWDTYNYTATSYHAIYDISADSWSHGTPTTNPDNTGGPVNAHAAVYTNGRVWAVVEGKNLISWAPGETRWTTGYATHPANRPILWYTMLSALGNYLYAFDKNGAAIYDITTDTWNDVLSPAIPPTPGGYNAPCGDVVVDAESVTLAMIGGSTTVNFGLPGYQYSEAQGKWTQMTGSPDNTGPGFFAGCCQAGNGSLWVTGTGNSDPMELLRLDPNGVTRTASITSDGDVSFTGNIDARDRITAPSLRTGLVSLPSIEWDSGVDMYLQEGVISAFSAYGHNSTPVDISTGMRTNESVRVDPSTGSGETTSVFIQDGAVTGLDNANNDQTTDLSIPELLAGKLRVGGGAWISGLDFGKAKGMTPNGQAEVFVSHNLGRKPTAVFVLGDDSSGFQYIKHAPAGDTASQACFVIRDINGGARTPGNNISFSWLAIA